MLSKSKPSILTAILHEEHPQKVVLTPDKFTVAFAVEDLYYYSLFVSTLVTLFKPIEIIQYSMSNLNTALKLQH